MNGTDPCESGAAPFNEEQILKTPESPYQKFPGADFGDLRMTDALLKHLGGISEKKALRGYLKLAPAYQQALAFVFDTGWPAVDLEKLFRGTTCPDNSYFKGAEVLAEMACGQICNATKLDPSNMRNGFVTTKGINELLDSAEDLPALMTKLVDQMGKDLVNSLQKLQGEEADFLKDLILNMEKQGVVLDRAELGRKIQMVYAMLKQADWKFARDNRLSSKNYPESSLPEPPVSEEKKAVLESSVPEEKKTASEAPSQKPSSLVTKPPPPEVQGEDVAMLRIAKALWIEKLFRKLHPFLKEDMYLLFHPRALLKALYFLTPDQMSLLMSLDKKDREIAEELNMKAVSVSARRKKCLQRLATAIGDIRAYIFSIQGLPVASVELSSADAKTIKRSASKPKKGLTRALRKKMLARISSALWPGLGELPPNEQLFFKGIVRKKPRWLKCVTGQNTKKSRADISGWPRKLLTDELGIESPVSKEAWKNAFDELSGSEKDIVRFRAKGGGFSAFSREYYGSSTSARATYKKALNRLFEILAAL